MPEYKLLHTFNHTVSWNRLFNNSTITESYTSKVSLYQGGFSSEANLFAFYIKVKLEVFTPDNGYVNWPDDFDLVNVEINGLDSGNSYTLTSFASNIDWILNNGTYETDYIRLNPENAYRWDQFKGGPATVSMILKTHNAIFPLGQSDHDIEVATRYFLTDGNEVANITLASYPDVYNNCVFIHRTDANIVDPYKAFIYDGTNWVHHAPYIRGDSRWEKGTS